MAIRKTTSTKTTSTKTTSAKPAKKSGLGADAAVHDAYGLRPRRERLGLRDVPNRPPPSSDSGISAASSSDRLPHAAVLRAIRYYVGLLSQPSIDFTAVADAHPSPACFGRPNFDTKK